MGRPSKAKQARIKNLLRAKARKRTLAAEDATTTDSTEDPDYTQNPTQNAADNLIEQGFFILDEDLGSDTDEDESDDEKEAVDVKTDADIFMFSRILAEAQLAAVKAEREAAQERPIRQQSGTIY